MDAKRIIISIACMFFLVSTISAFNFGDTATSSSTTVYFGNLTNITQMADVNVVTPITGQGLIWNAVSGAWENGVLATVETLWNANYSTFLTHVTWAEVVNGTVSGGGITWANAVNGTLMKSADWNSTNTSYYLTSNPYGFYNVTTAPIYLNDTFRQNYSDYLTIRSYALNDTNYNSTGLIKDWNATGYIQDWQIKINSANTSMGYYANTTVNNSMSAYVDAKLITTIFNASAIQVVLGTPAGAIGNLQTYDSISYNVSEASSDLDLRVNFSSITNFNQIIVRYKSDVAESHTMDIALWDYVNGVWESYRTVGVSPDYNIMTMNVYDVANHISGGIVQVRFYSVNAGGSTHKHQFDWVAISDGTATPSSSETDPYSIHKDGQVTLTANWAQGAFNLTDTSSWFLGLINHSQIVNQPAYLTSETTWLANYSNYLSYLNYHTNNTFSYYNSTNAPIYLNDTFRANYSAYLSYLNYNFNNTWGYYNSTTAPIYLNDTFRGTNYSTFLTHITYAQALNGSITSGYYNVTNAPIYLNDTFRNNYSNYTTGWLYATNSTGSSVNWDNNYSNFSAVYGYALNASTFTQATYNTNYTDFRPLINLSWWTTNYTANDALYRSWSANYSNFSTKIFAWDNNYSNFSAVYGYALNASTFTQATYNTNYTDFRPLINLSWFTTNYTANDANYRSFSANYSNFTTGWLYATNSTMAQTTYNTNYTDFRPLINLTWFTTNYTTSLAKLQANTFTENQTITNNYITKSVIPENIINNNNNDFYILDPVNGLKISIITCLGYMLYKKFL